MCSHGIKEPEDKDIVETEEATVDIRRILLIPKQMEDELDDVLQSYIEDGRATLHEFD
jgi:hypothetical protein